MMNAGTKGKICCQQGDVEFDWTIENFLSLPQTVDHYYCSPSFHFCGRSWYLKLYPKGRRGFEDFIVLYITSANSDPPLEIRYTFGIKAPNGETEVWRNGSAVFDKRNSSWGYSNCILISELLRRKDDLWPSNVLTLTATMKTGKEEALTPYRRRAAELRGLCRRVQTSHMCIRRKSTTDVSVQTTVEDHDKGEPPQKTGSDKVLQDMRSLWLTGDNSDVIIKVGDVEFKAHRAILAIRTPVMCAMFKHNTAEKDSGDVTISDCEPAVFEQFLNYIYTGAPRDLNADNASALYAVADKYLVSEVKELCVRCLQDTLCPDTFCDVVTLSLVHKEEKLLEMATDFLSKNMANVMKTVQWQKFLPEHPTWANEITIRAAQQIEARNEK